MCFQKWSLALRSKTFQWEKKGDISSEMRTQFRVFEDSKSLFSSKCDNVFEKRIFTKLHIGVDFKTFSGPFSWFGPDLDQVQNSEPYRSHCRPSSVGIPIAVTTVINLPASGGRKEFVYDQPSLHLYSDGATPFTG